MGSFTFPISILGQCDAGWYCSLSSTTARPTVPAEGGQCTAGHYCPAGSSKETPCQEGFYCDVSFRLSDSDNDNEQLLRISDSDSDNG